MTNIMCVALGMFQQKGGFEIYSAVYVQPLAKVEKDFPAATESYG